MNTYPFILGGVTHIAPGYVYERKYFVAGIEVARDGETYLTVWQFRDSAAMQLFAHGYSGQYSARYRLTFGEYVTGYDSIEDYGVNGLPTAVADILHGCEKALTDLKEDIARRSPENFAKLETATTSEGVQRLARDW